MKLGKKITAVLGAATIGLALASCGAKSKTTTEVETTTELTTTQTREQIEKESVTVGAQSDSLYVEKVENLSDDFIMGMDASSVIAEEQSGVKYYGFDGEEKDLFEVLAENGINYIRVRVWNDPYDENGNGYGGGTNDIEKCIEIGKRATKYGMKLLVNFHYSDFWADPSRQLEPKSMQGMSVDEKADAIYEYTKDCLTRLYMAGVDVGMVQVGNETNNGICGETDWPEMCTLFNAGSKAVREVLPDALVAVHFANPETTNRYTSYAIKLSSNHVDYDVFASSYYPYWHGTLSNLSTVLSKIAKSYDKKVMVAETSYAYTNEDTDLCGNTICQAAGDGNTYDYPVSIAGQANHVRNVVNTIANTTNGIGVFYWEGAWISVGSEWESNKAKWEKYGSGWAASYAGDYDPDNTGAYVTTTSGGGCVVDNQAFFDSTGHPLESLKVWYLLREGNTNVPKYIDGYDSPEVTASTGDDVITLPETVMVTYNDNTKEAAAVTWDFTEENQAACKAGGNKDYTITGHVGDIKVSCLLHMLAYNYLSNYSFEGDSDWTTDYVVTKTSVYNAAISNDNVNAKTGKYSYHAWAKNANTVLFNFYQDVTGLEAGKYSYSISILGGPASGTAKASLQNIYMFVKINGEETYTLPMNFTNYNAGFKTYTISDIVVAEGDTVTVGVYCQADEAGSWVDFDDAMLNKQVD